MGERRVRGQVDGREVEVVVHGDQADALGAGALDGLSIGFRDEPVELCERRWRATERYAVDAEAEREAAVYAELYG